MFTINKGEADTEILHSHGVLIMFGGLELLHLAFTVTFMLIFLVIAFFMLFVMFRALRAPRNNFKHLNCSL
jgi:hypothetical protein